MKAYPVICVIGFWTASGQSYTKVQDCVGYGTIMMILSDVEQIYYNCEILFTKNKNKTKEKFVSSTATRECDALR